MPEIPARHVSPDDPPMRSDVAASAPTTERVGRRLLGFGA